MKSTIDYVELINLHSELASDAICLLNVLKSNVTILPEGVSMFMPKLREGVMRLSEIEFTDWIDDNSDSLESENPENIPDLLYNDHKRFAPYEEIFEEWCEAWEIKFFGTNQDEIIQTLSHLIGDCAEFFTDLSAQYPYEKDNEN